MFFIKRKKIKNIEESRNKKLKIGFFTDTYHPQLNGVVSSIDTFKNELTTMGHEVIVFAPDYNGILPRKKLSEKNILRFPSISYPFYKEFRVAWPYSPNYLKFKKLNIDIYHLHSPFSIGILGFFLSKLYNRPAVMTYHTLWKEYGPTYAPFLPKTLVENLAISMSKKFCDQLDMVIVPSNAMKKEAESYGLKKEVRVIPTGFTLDKQVINHKFDLHKKYKIEKEKEIILYVGRIGSEKNISLLIRSYKKVLNSHPKTHLVIIGDGPDLMECKNLIRKFGIEKNVTFTGFLGKEDVLAAMSKSKLFAFPSTTETQGLVVLEALACGLPTVAINRMGSIDYLYDGKGGILTEPTPDDFSKGINKLLDYNDYDKLKEQALEKAKLFTTEVVTEKLINVYKEIYANRNSRKRSKDKIKTS